MARLKLILALVVAGGFAGLAVWQYQTAAKLRAENQSLKEQLGQLTQAAHDSDSNASGGASAALSQEQLAELLKLRGEVTQLRAQTNEISSLRRQTEELRTALKKASVPPPQVSEKKSPEDALPQDIHPKETWAFRGYASPESTVESMVWAATRGDKSTFLAGLSPELQAHFESEFRGKDFAQEMTNIGEFRILGRKTVSDDEMVVTVYTIHMEEGGGSNSHSSDTHFKRIDGQWKVFEKE